VLVNALNWPPVPSSEASSRSIAIFDLTTHSLQPTLSGYAFSVNIYISLLGANITDSWRRENTTVRAESGYAMSVVPSDVP
jgi:hypothetical protein